MAVIDPDCACNHTDTKEQYDGFERPEVFSAGDIIKQTEDGDKLEGDPDFGDERVGRQMLFANVRVCIFCVEAKDGVKTREQIPCRQWQESDCLTAIKRSDPGKRNERQRKPEWQGAAETSDLLGIEHLTNLYSGQLAELLRGSVERALREVKCLSHDSGQGLG